MNYKNLQFNLGDRRLVNQQKAKKYLTRILRSGRMGHAYLLTGRQGSGKTALALAFAEIINGVDNLTNLAGQRFSKKSSWFTHPDIHLFLPMPTHYNLDELRERLTLLAVDPYEIVDFNRRPSLTDEQSSKNKQAFYPIDYFHEEIRPKAFLKPNEGEKTVVILAGIETMRKEAANAFLKLLEEPAENLIFVLLTDHPDALLPTIRSRCQQIKLNTLSIGDVEQALIRYENLQTDDARYMARVSGGNYALSRLHNIELIKNKRTEVIEFLRSAYTKNAPKLYQTVNDWQKEFNIEGQIMLLDVLANFLRDLLVYRETKQENLITNIDRLEVIQKFCDNLKNASVNKMIEQVNKCRPLVYQNVQAKLVFTVLAFRLADLMQNSAASILKQEY